MIIHLANLLEWEMLHTEVVQKIKTHILCSITFFPKVVTLIIVEKYDIARQVTYDNIIRRTRFACWCWITTATDRHSEYVILFAFPQIQWFREHVSMLCLYEHYQPFYSKNGTCPEAFTPTELNTSIWGWKHRQVVQKQLNHVTQLSVQKACRITTVPNLYAFFMQL